MGVPREGVEGDTEFGDKLILLWGSRNRQIQLDYIVDNNKGYSNKTLLLTLFSYISFTVFHLITFVTFGIIRFFRIAN